MINEQAVGRIVIRQYCEQLKPYVLGLMSYV